MSSSSWHRGSPRPSRARGGGGRIFSPSGRRRHRVPRARPGPPRPPRWRSRETMPDGVGLVTHGGPASRSPLKGGRPDASGRRGQTAAASQGPEGTARGGAGPQRGWADLQTGRTGRRGRLWQSSGLRGSLDVRVHRRVSGTTDQRPGGTRKTPGRHTAATRGAGQAERFHSVLLPKISPSDAREELAM